MHAHESSCWFGCVQAEGSTASQHAEFQCLKFLLAFTQLLTKKVETLVVYAMFAEEYVEGIDAFLSSDIKL